MFSAVRRARRELGQKEQLREGRLESTRDGLQARSPSLAGHCRNLAQQAARAAGDLGSHLAAVAARAAAPLLQLDQQQQQQQCSQIPSHQLLLASVSGSALDQPQKAYLPDKRRPAAGGRGPSSGAADGGSSSGGGAGDGGGSKDMLADADENERFLISEVR